MGGYKGSEVLYRSIIKSQSFSEPIPLDCEFCNFFSVFPPLLDGGGVGRMARVG